MKRGKHSAIKNFFHSPLILMLIFGVFVFVAQGSWKMFVRARSSADRLARAERELSSLEERKKELSFNIARLSTEQGMEAELRTKYRAVGDGESVAIILGGEQTTATTTPVSRTNIEDWWRSVVRFFGFSRD